MCALCTCTCTCIYMYILYMYMHVYSTVFTMYTSHTNTHTYSLAVVLHVHVHVHCTMYRCNVQWIQVLCLSPPLSAVITFLLPMTCTESGESTRRSSGQPSSVSRSLSLLHHCLVVTVMCACVCVCVCVCRLPQRSRYRLSEQVGS